jgi:hypothetical protein
MAFDASRQREPEHQHAPAFQEEPIDWVDWGMRIAVFGPLLALYSYWLWTILKTGFAALFGG